MPMSVDFEIFMALEAGFAPTSERVAHMMMEIANLRREELFYDLGSGEGTLLIMAAKDFGARAIGIELQRKLVVRSRSRIRNLGLEDKIEVVRGDFFKIDVNKADVIALYLTPWALRKLRSKLDRELKPGARVVSYKYPVEDWKPKRIFKATDQNGKTKIFLYTF